MNDQEILQAIGEAKKAKKRKFKQSLDLVINLRGLDFNKPDSKIDLKILLPEGRGKAIKIGVFGDADFLKKAKNADLKISDSQIKKTPKEIKKVASEADFFIAQTTMMVEIGKNWGKFLSPRGKMPQPMPPAADPTPAIERLKKTVALKSKGRTPQTIQCFVGVEDMDDQKILNNVKTVLNALLEKLPAKEQNIRSLFIKMTMGPSIRLTI